MNRGKETSLTKLLKSKKSFQSKILDPGKWELPMYILCGLKNSKGANIVDTYSLAEYFFRNETPGVHERVSNALFKYADYAAKQYSDRFLSVLTKGSRIFESPEIFQEFYENPLLNKYELDEFSLTKYLFHGEKGKNWYPETLKAFEDMLKGYDIELFVKLFAITSPRNNFKANLGHAFRAYELFNSKKSFEQGNFLPNVLSMLNDFRNKDFIFEQEQRNGRRKITNFALGILGKKDAIVVDSWVLKAYGLSEEYLWRGKKAPYSPRVTEYDLIEDHIKRLAECCGYEPRQIIAMLWHGIRTLNSPHKATEARKILQELLK